MHTLLSRAAVASRWPAVSLSVLPAHLIPLPPGRGRPILTLGPGTHRQGEANSNPVADNPGRRRP
jgi:hypothetical protein